MNITIDKAPTLAALQAAEVAFLNIAKQMRIADNETSAKLYEEYAESIAVLREQIKTHGKVANDDARESDAA